LSELETRRKQSTFPDRTLEYALAAALLHPYGKNLETLRFAATRSYWRLDSIAAFKSAWNRLEEQFRRMEGSFSDLRQLREALGHEQSIEYREKTFTQLQAIIHAELPS
jgi:hypothetical protein